MFGLTRREQCWAAEQQAAELIAGVAKAALLAKTEIAKADANAGLSAALAKVEELERQVKVLQSAENSWQSGYDEGRRMGGKGCELTRDSLTRQRDHLAALLRLTKTIDWARLDLDEWSDRVDAALATICAAAPNIAPTSEHSGS